MTFIGGILVVIIKDKSPEIKTFEVSEYQYYIDNFSLSTLYRFLSNDIADAGFSDLKT